VLVENFTWDWIYETYATDHSGFAPHIAYLADLFKRVDSHIQAEPVCMPVSPDLTTPPVSRPPRLPTREIRSRLEIPETAKMVLITMGGIPASYGFFSLLADHPEICFVVPGGSRQMAIQNNIRRVPFQTDLYHPDLIHASDAVIGKAGYSTLAETYHAGVPFGYISRASFRESKYLVDFIRKEMDGMPIHEKDFEAGKWLPGVKDLLAYPKKKRATPNGAEEIARFILARC
jgi:UDP-N-acetylglucosamine:LPS N-acetylglucosamine transferase